MKENQLTAAAQEARRRYWRQYYASHKEQDRERKRRYWERKAAQAQAQAEGGTTNDAVHDNS